MPLRPETKTLFNAEAIRTATAVNSSSLDVGGVTGLTVFLDSSLNQGGNLQAQVSFDDGATWVNIGPALAVAALAGVSVHDVNTGTNLANICRMKDGLIRFVFTATVAPATGTLTLRVFRVYI